MRCEYCNHPFRTDQDGDFVCDSCDLYNAAVAAQKAAAQHIATAFDRRAKNAWLNEFGVFAQIGELMAVQVGTPEQAAPFFELTGEARRVKKFQTKDPA
jgi:hypothetical protein